VIDLPDRQGAALVDRIHDAGQPGYVAVVKQAHRIGVIARARRDHHGLGDDHCGPAPRALAVIELVALGGEAVGGAEVGPHRAHDDAVAQAQRAHAAGLSDQHVESFMAVPFG
jgi:hypothetical protein